MSVKSTSSQSSPNPWSLLSLPPKHDTSEDNYLTASVHSVHSVVTNPSVHLSRSNSLEDFGAHKDHVESQTENIGTEPGIEIMSKSPSLPSTTPLVPSTETTTENKTWKTYVVDYFAKFGGVKGRQPPTGTLNGMDILTSTIISFIGIFVIGTVDVWYLKKYFQNKPLVITILVGSFGAAAVLVFDAYLSPLAQPRNVILSQTLGSFIGVCVRLFSQSVRNPSDSDAEVQWWAAALAVSLTVAFMRGCNIVHPPGGATALIAVIGGQSVRDLGFGYVATCTAGGIICVSVAVIFNNLVPWRQYPLYW